MITGFIVKGMTVKGSIEVKRNSVLPLNARLILKRKIVSRDPFVVKFAFRRKLRKVSSVYSEESLVEALRVEMKECVEGVDYAIEVLEDD